MPKGSRRNKFTFWRERRAGRCEAPRRRRCRTSSRSGNEADTRPCRRAPAGCGPQARWLCCSLLTYRPGYSSSLAPRQRAWGPAAKCEVISARALRGECGTLGLPQRREESGFALAFELDVPVEIVAPGFRRIAEADRDVKHGGDPIGRAWLPDKVHPCLLRRPAALLVIAFEATGHNIVP